jgi:hypothetical protein
MHVDLSLSLSLLLLFYLPKTTQTCRIAGTDSGECRTYEENEIYMPFCSAFVKYDACVPLSVQTPGGDWDNHTLPTKDKWVADTTMTIILERIRHEMNETLDKLEVNEVGEDGLMTKRFWNLNKKDPRGVTHAAKKYGGSPKTDCEKSFIQYQCYLNFPRCDSEGRSLILCRSVCENYMNACGYQSDLWRCGDPRFHGAEEPEVPEQDESTGQYDITWRTMFPGAPFKDNEFDRSDPEQPVPIVVCTPSVLNTAKKTQQHFFSIICFLISVLVVIF